jgi:hypothetical protein
MNLKQRINNKNSEEDHIMYFVVAGISFIHPAPSLLI